MLLSNQNLEMGENNIFVLLVSSNCDVSVEFFSYLGICFIESLFHLLEKVRNIKKGLQCGSFSSRESLFKIFLVIQVSFIVKTFMNEQIVQYTVVFYPEVLVSFSFANTQTILSEDALVYSYGHWLFNKGLFTFY